MIDDNDVLRKVCLITKGYKVFNNDWTCRDFQYKVGETYEMDGKPECCRSGFHFCERLIDCFNYYAFDPTNKVAEIESLGDVDFRIRNGSNKCCTNKIKIVKELSWEEVLTLVNIGNYNTGYRNAGDFNTGNYNTGNSNTGSYNTGDYNTGYYNTSKCNTGNCNTGNFNTGSCNTGYRNAGYRNIGHRNAGYRNIGHHNTGCCNTGDFNTGDYNKTSFSTGRFNTQEQTIFMFNKQSSWTIDNWQDSKARNILNEMPIDELEWINLSDISDEEKELHSSCKTIGGYLKNIEVSTEEKQKWWINLSDWEREEVLNLPNFNKDIFKEITGIDVEIGC